MVSTRDLERPASLQAAREAAMHSVQSIPNRLAAFRPSAVKSYLADGHIARKWSYIALKSPQPAWHSPHRRAVDLMHSQATIEKPTNPRRGAVGTEKNYRDYSSERATDTSHRDPSRASR